MTSPWRLGRSAPGGYWSQQHSIRNDHAKASAQQPKHQVFFRFLPVPGATLAKVTSTASIWVHTHGQRLAHLLAPVAGSGPRNQQLPVLRGELQLKAA